MTQQPDPRADWSAVTRDDVTNEEHLLDSVAGHLPDEDASDLRDRLESWYVVKPARSASASTPNDVSDH